MKDVIISKEMLDKLERACVEFPACNGFWNVERDEILRRYYGRVDKSKLVELLGARNVAQLYKRYAVVKVRD